MRLRIAARVGILDMRRIRPLIDSLKVGLQLKAAAPNGQEQMETHHAPSDIKKHTLEIFSLAVLAPLYNLFGPQLEKRACEKS